MVLRARVHDPSAWLRVRTLAYGAAGVLLLVALAVPNRASIGALLVTFLASLLAPLVRPRRRASVDVHLAPGVVTFVYARSRWLDRVPARSLVAALMTRRVRARDLVGASTTATARGVALALSSKDRPDAPVIVEVEDLDEARAIRDALGVGHQGVGHLRWRLGPTWLDRVVLAFHGLLAATVAIAACVTLFGRGGADGLSLYMVLQGLGIFVLVSVAASRETNPALVLEPLGLRFTGTAASAAFAPYAAIRSATRVPEGILLTFDDGPSRLVAMPSPRSALNGFAAGDPDDAVAQIASAVERARGLGAVAPQSAARLETLRRNGDPPRAWLARLDATASVLRSAAGYRSASLTEADLWDALADHDADPELRAGAARVLTRIDAAAASARVDTLLATLRDEADAHRVRVCVDPDVDRASAALEEIERDEVHRRARAAVATRRGSAT